MASTSAATKSKETESEADMEIDANDNRKRRNPQREASKSNVYQFPKKRNTAKLSVTAPMPAIDVTNVFEPLSDASSESSDDPDAKRQKTKHSPKAAKKNPLLKNVASKPRKPMPIRVPSSSFNEIENVIKSLSLSDYTITKMSATDYKIDSSSTADKKAILEKLKSVGIGNYTHSERHERKMTFVLKNHYEKEPEVVLKELQQLKIPAKTISKIGKSEENPIYAVHFEKGSTSLDTLTREFSVINNLKIRWAKHQPRMKRYIQCSNCQRWGHGKANCNLPRRCVKCKQQHGEEECLRKKRTDDGEPACVNCGKSGHPANATICEVYKKHVEAIEKRKRVTSTRQPRRFTSTPAPWASNSNSQHFPPLPNSVNLETNRTPSIAPNREYRPFLTQPRVNSEAQNSEFNILNMNAELMSIPGMAETMKLYRKLLEDLRQAPTPHQKLAILLNHGLSLCV